jgi:putative membrane protein
MKAPRQSRGGRTALAAGLLLMTTLTVRAHGADVGVAARWWQVWSFEPAVVTGLFVIGALYASGLRFLREATAATRKFRREAACFAAGWGVLVIALLSPVHPLGQVLFSVHMTQHELLMVVAAPLLVLGRPTVVWLWALPRTGVNRAAAQARAGGVHRVWQASTNVVLATLVHGLALWIWHVPSLFEATLTHESVHALQHLCFLLSAVLFWQALFFGRHRRSDYGLAVLMLFATAVHSGALGALITFASQLWYESYATTTTAWGMAPLEDQQLGGLIMWIPAGLIYVVAALALFAAWLKEAGARRGERPTSNIERPTSNPEREHSTLNV